MVDATLNQLQLSCPIHEDELKNTIPVLLSPTDPLTMLQLVLLLLIVEQALIAMERIMF